MRPPPHRSAGPRGAARHAPEDRHQAGTAPASARTAVFPTAAGSEPARLTRMTSASTTRGGLRVCVSASWHVSRAMCSIASSLVLVLAIQDQGYRHPAPWEAALAYASVPGRPVPFRKVLLGSAQTPGNTTLRRYLRENACLPRSRECSAGCSRWAEAKPLYLIRRSSKTTAVTFWLHSLLSRSSRKRIAHEGTSLLGIIALPHKVAGDPSSPTVSPSPDPPAREAWQPARHLKRPRRICGVRQETIRNAEAS